MLVTVHNNFHNPVHPLTDDVIDDTMNAWKWIFDNWHTTIRRPIPDSVRKYIKFHPQLGMCGGNLCTKNAAIGMQGFIARLNNIH
jgi:hypothetical protein